MSFIEIYSKEKKHKKRLKFTHSSIDSGSGQSNSTNDEKQKKIKFKTVNFNGVEIIDVESYKVYNQLNNVVQLESIDNNQSDCKVCNCLTF